MHNRCIQMGKKFDCDIIAKSTFSDEGGTKICQQIETSEVKSIVKNEKLVTIEMEKERINKEEFYDIYQNLLKNNIIVEAFKKERGNIQFIIKKTEQNKVQGLLENRYSTYKIKQTDLVKLSVIGYGITQDNHILNQVIKILKKHNIEIMDINLTQAKIEILVKELENYIVTELHKKLIED